MKAWIPRFHLKYIPTKTNVNATKAHGPRIHTIGEKYVTRHVVNCVITAMGHEFDLAVRCILLVRRVQICPQLAYVLVTESTTLLWCAEGCKEHCTCLQRYTKCDEKIEKSGVHAKKCECMSSPARLQARPVQSELTCCSSSSIGTMCNRPRPMSTSNTWRSSNPSCA